MVQHTPATLLLAILAALVLPQCVLTQSGSGCTGKPALSLVLIGASSPRCYSTEVGAMWTVINVATYPNCESYNYTVSGAGLAYDTAPNNEASRWRYPTSPAVTYKASSGSQALYQSYAYSQTSQNTNALSSYTDNGQEVTVFRPSSFTGFTQTLIMALPQLVDGPFGPTTNLPVPYAITAAADKGGITIVSPPTNCTFTYRVTSGGFAGLSPVKPAAGADGCANTPGFYQPTIAGAKVCAVCPAGTFSSGGAAAGGSCGRCSAGGVANAAAGSAGLGACQSCGPGKRADSTATSCVGACDPSYAEAGSYGPAVFSSGNAFTAGSSGTCSQVKCPNGTIVNAQLSACLGSKSGQLCQLAPGNAKVPCGPGFKPEAAPPVGGAVLALASADVSKPNCARAVAPLVKWLQSGNRVTWMGYDLSGNSSTVFQQAGVDAGGVQWQVLGGALPTKILLPYSVCGNAHGGPGPQPGLTQSGVPLDTNALLFNTILDNSMPLVGNSSLLQGGGWGIIAQAGSEPNTITTTWFQDSSFGTCGITSVTAAVPSDTCTLKFKVVGGSILGVKAANRGCPAGTHSVIQLDKTESCFACAAGYAYKGGKCVACTGKTYQPWYGDAPDCKACNGDTYGGNNWFCYGQPYVPRFRDS